MRISLFAATASRRAHRSRFGERTGTVKIGLILPYSGQFADTATQIDNGIKLYMKQHGDTVAGRKIEIIRKDTGGVAPDVAKRLAQELVVRDKVDILAGFVLTPERASRPPTSRTQAKKFMVIMNAATSIITTKSQYSTRTSVTLPRSSETLGAWAAKNGIKKTYTMVSDYGPGHDSEGAFHRAFKAAGGEIVGSVRMPVANPDFSAFVQRAKDLNPESIFVFVPAGAQPAALGKAFAERGVDPKQDQDHGHRRGDRRVGGQEHGRCGARHHHGLALRLQSQVQDEQGLRRRASTQSTTRNPNFFSVGGYDGMHLIYEALKKTGGKTDGEALIDRRQGHDVGKPARPDLDRSGNPRHHPDDLYPPGAKGRQRTGQRRVRQGRERQGSGEGRDEEVNSAVMGVRRRRALGPPAFVFGLGRAPIAPAVFGAFGFDRARFRR